MSMPHGRTRITGIKSLLTHPEVRRLERDGRTLYAAVEVVAVLTDSQHAAEQWADLKRHESALDAMHETASIGEQIVDVLPLEGVLRLIQSLNSSKAEKLKSWMGGVATQALEEEDNPELALLRTRSLYQKRGYSRRWIDQRMRSVSARQELTSEWYRRGARESEQFRQLTNALIAGAFGVEVEPYRRLKGLGGTRENLRDHMTDMELALTSLAEAATVADRADRAGRTIPRTGVCGGNGIPAAMRPPRLRTRSQCPARRSLRFRRKRHKANSPERRPCDWRKQP